MQPGCLNPVFLHGRMTARPSPSVILKGGTCWKALLLSVCAFQQACGAWAWQWMETVSEEPLGKEMIGILKGLSEQWL